MPLPKVERHSNPSATYMKPFATFQFPLTATQLFEQGGSDTLAWVQAQVRLSEFEGMDSQAEEGRQTIKPRNQGCISLLNESPKSPPASHILFQIYLNHKGQSNNYTHILQGLHRLSLPQEEFLNLQTKDLPLSFHTHPHQRLSYWTLTTSRTLREDFILYVLSPQLELGLLQDELPLSAPDTSDTNKGSQFRCEITCW